MIIITGKNFTRCCNGCRWTGIWDVVSASQSGWSKVKCCYQYTFNVNKSHFISYTTACFKNSEFNAMWTIYHLHVCHWPWTYNILHPRRAWQPFHLQFKSMKCCKVPCYNIDVLVWIYLLEVWCYGRVSSSFPISDTCRVIQSETICNKYTKT